MTTLWMGMLLSGILLFLLTMTLFVVWKVPNLIDELSGRKARRQINRMKQLNISTDSLSRMSTGDFYRLSGGGSEWRHVSGDLGSQELKPETVTDVNKMLDNPYEAVYKETGVVPNLKRNIERGVITRKEEEVSEDDTDTAPFEEPTAGSVEIKILQEKTSLTEG